MSGHNKWASIKHKKAAVDAKRGQLFSKVIKEITVAARLGGGDPEGNARLRAVVLKAKEANMPNVNIERAIKKGTGEIAGEQYEEINYEAYGPGGAALIITALTDNKNRTVAEIRSMLTKNGGNMGETGSVGWQFEKKGIISIEKNQVKSEDELMELVLEAGGEDIVTEEEGYTIKTDPRDFLTVLNILKNKNIATVEAEIEFTAKNLIDIEPDKREKLARVIEMIEDNDDVQSVACNARFD
ncbi:MAG: transcriptional regulator [Spirochaetes bacterium GWF1_41_5]|nr:MAG: transcriptional regulator [Spirochaetes bacterium GWF1_41_5]HBE01200.1 YebC/PmpR family DNA-binding transcriptional regulator [Spirochaetia bacterium]